MASSTSLPEMAHFILDRLYHARFLMLIAFSLYIAYRVIDRAVFTYRIRQRYGDLPHLPRHWIWGNVINAGAKLNPSNPRHPDYGFEEIWDELGRPPCYTMDLAPIDRGFLIVCHPDAAEAITQPSIEYKYSVPKSDTYKHNISLLGSESIVTREGEEWKSLRRRFNPGFQPKYLHSLAPIIVSKTEMFIDRLKAAAKSGNVIRLELFAKDLTTDIITQLAVGRDLKAQSTPDGTGEKGRFGVLRASRRLSELVFAAGRSINITLFDPVRPVKNFFYEQVFDRKIHGWVAQQVTAMEGKSEKAPENERSISQLAMAGLQPTPKLVQNTVDQIKSFLFAGQDTTSTLVQWMAYEMSKALYDPRHAEILMTLRAEHNKVFSSGDPWSALSTLSSTADSESILNTKLPYTTAFVKETLRLHPPASTARLIPESPPFVITVDGEQHDISGLRIYISQWLLHRNPAVWGEDATVFKPERWLDEAYMAKLPVGSWRPFERGPRNCIGQELAMMEGKMVLCAMARGFEWEKVGLTGRKNPATGEMEKEMWAKFAVTSVPCDGMMMRVSLAKGKK